MTKTTPVYVPPAVLEGAWQACAIADGKDWMLVGDDDTSRYRGYVRATIEALPERVRWALSDACETTWDELAQAALYGAFPAYVVRRMRRDPAYRVLSQRLREASAERDTSPDELLVSVGVTYRIAVRFRRRPAAYIAGQVEDPQPGAAARAARPQCLETETGDGSATAGAQ